MIAAVLVLILVAIVALRFVTTVLILVIAAVLLFIDVATVELRLVITEFILVIAEVLFEILVAIVALTVATSDVNATVPVASGNVTVLSAVGSVTANVVSFALAVEPSKIIIGFEKTPLPVSLTLPKKSVVAKPILKCSWSVPPTLVKNLK